MIFPFFSAYADDNESMSKNSDKSIPPKLVPDRKINDKNTFMGDFGFPAREDLKFNLNMQAQDQGIYSDVKLAMKNRWSTSNVWGKDKLYFETSLSGGIMGFNYFAVSSSDVEQLKPFVPYGALYIKLFGGSRFSPEIKIQDSTFMFGEPDINALEQNQNYNYYYLKLPLGFSIPFIGYKSQVSVDGSYSSLYSNFRVKNPFLIKGRAVKPGDTISTISNSWNVRLYLDTPVVLKPSISEHAYFGVYYDETISPRTSSPGSDYPDHKTMVVMTTGRSGGFFYDMKQDLYKGIIFGIQVNLGFGDIEVKENTASYKGLEYDSSKGVIAYKAVLMLGYEHIFQKYHTGVGIEIGAEYGGYIPFFYAKHDNLHGLRTDGDLKYFMELKLLFGY